MGQRRRFLLPFGLLSCSVLLTLLIHLEPLAAAGAQLAGSAVGWCALLAAMTLSSYCGMFQLQQCHLQGSPDMWHLSNLTTTCAHALVLGLTISALLLPSLHAEETSGNGVEAAGVEAAVEEAVNCEIMQALLTIAAVIMASLGCKELFSALSTEKLQSAYNAVSTSDSEFNLPQLQFSTGECTTTGSSSKQMRTVVVSDVIATRSQLRAHFRIHGEIKAVKHLSGDKSVALIEYARADEALSALVLNGTVFNDCSIKVDTYDQQVHVPATCNQMYDARLESGRNSNNRQSSATKSDDIFPSADQSVALTTIRVEETAEDQSLIEDPPELAEWKEAYETDRKIPPAMKRHCKQHGIDKKGAVRLLKQDDADLNGKDESYQCFKERCTLLFHRVLHRWQVGTEEGVLASATGGLLDVAHDFIEKKTLLEFWLKAPDIHKLFKKSLSYDKDQKYKIVKIEHWETLMVSLFDSQGAEQFAVWLSRVEDVFLS